LPRFSHRCASHNFLEVSFVTSELRQKLIDTYIFQKYGISSLRLFRILLMRGSVEESELVKICMISAAEARERLLGMLHCDLLEVREIPKGKPGDYKPSSVLFFWHVNCQNVLRILVDQTYHAAHNVLVRLHHELDQNLALLTKADEAVDPKNGLSLTKDEKSKLQWVKEVQERMEDAILSLDETIVLLTDPAATQLNVLKQ